jgi:transcriptional regulator with XRE-family HTH domain
MQPVRSPAEVGALFRARRRELSLTQELVTESCRATRPTVRKLEQGGAVTLTTKRAISAALDWPLDAYERLQLGHDLASLVDAAFEPISAAAGLAEIEQTLRRMGLAPVAVEIALAAVTAATRSSP